jgi:hypothetical protein
MRRNLNVEPSGISFNNFATSKCRVPTMDLSLIFSIWSPILIRFFSRSIILPSLIRLIKAKPNQIQITVKENKKQISSTNQRHCQ